MNNRFVRLLLVSLGLFQVAGAEETRLLRHPTVSRDAIAFEYASDLWIVPRTGGQARRLTSTPGAETEPRFSPDGSQIAYTATVAGNTDVYVVSAAGGEPKRLTWHPGLAVVDELAHTNAPGSRHPKRYQDVLELLDAGINVYTTLNVQHVASRSDVVRQISGISVHETVPDSVLDLADEEAWCRSYGRWRNAK